MNERTGNRPAEVGERQQQSQPLKQPKFISAGSGGKEKTRAACDGVIVQAASEQDAHKLRDARKEQVGFGCEYVRGFAAIEAQAQFELRNRAFHGCALFVKRVKLVIVARDAGIKA